jgi:hypothetical protein
MKKIYLSLISLLFAISCFGQGIEVYGSLNTSSEQRFQPGYGIGIQYQQNLSHSFLAGLGVSYYLCHAKFDQVPFIDGAPTLLVGQHIKSDSRRFAVRLNVQAVLKDNQNVSLTLGPAVSYNMLWGTDEIQERSGQSNWTNYSQKIKKVKDFGVGLISSMEVKNFIAPQLSLSFSIRPEILIGSNEKRVGASAPPFSGNLLFTEFQVGLKYRFKN